MNLVFWVCDLVDFGFKAVFCWCDWWHCCAGNELYNHYHH